MLSLFRPSVRPSVCLSVTRVDQSKTLEVRIMQLSPQSSPVTSFLAVNFTAKFQREHRNSSFRKYKMYADIRGGSPGRGRQMTVRLSTSIFGDLGGYFFGNVRDKASNITWRYATNCRSVIDCKINDLE